MPAKAPVYLKPTNGKAATSHGRGDKKLRGILSTELISLPLGDFRHTAHVGRGDDDVFGDVTFLQQDPKAVNKSDTAVARGSLRRSGKGNKKSRYDRDKPDRRPLSNQSCDGYGLLDSPILQSAISLPMLNQPSTLSIAKPYPETQQTKSKKTKKLSPNNNNMGYNKAKSHDTGLNCLSVATVQSGDYERSSSDATGDFNNQSCKRSLNSVGESEGSRSSTTLPEKAHVTSLMMSSDKTSFDEPWTFDLDLGNSLLDEIMTVLDKPHS